MELKDKLAELQDTLESKTAANVKSLMGEYYEGMKAEMDELKSENVDAFEELKGEFKQALDAIQEHTDKIDAKLSAPAAKAGQPVDELKQLITDNFDSIKRVGKGREVELKAVGNMTLGNHLTGDQPLRDRLSYLEGSLRLCVSVVKNLSLFFVPFGSGA